MSQTLDNFKTAALAKNWSTAVPTCNGLNMYEMLRGLDSLPRNLLEDLRAQLVIFVPGLSAERINYAIDVVKNRRLPATAPGDLNATGQVQDARNFLNSVRAVHEGSKKKLQVALFWTMNARGEGVSSSLIQKAQDLFHGNGDQFTLDVLRVHTDLPTNQDLSEADPESCGSQEFTQVQALADRSGVYGADRVPIIFYTSLVTLDAHGSPHDPISHGCGYQASATKGYAMINVRSVAADRGTLAHELGHAAGLQHDFSDNSNIMSYGASRTVIKPTQLSTFGKAYFCR